jgi:hypothetical protein
MSKNSKNTLASAAKPATSTRTAKNTKTEKTGSGKVTTATLRTWNKVLALVYAVQGVAILLLSIAKTVPLTVSYLTENPLATEAAGETVWSQATRTVADVNLAHIIAAFLFISALVHASAAWWWRAAYERELENKVNRLRWFANIPVVSLLFITLAVLVGVSALSVLLMFVVLSALALLLAFVTERQRQQGKPRLLYCVLSLVAAFTPWAVLALYLAAAHLYGTGANLPAYVYSALASLLLLSVGAALLSRFQDQKKGAWANYLFSERGYMILGLAAQTVLAWLVYAGTLQP